MKKITSIFAFFSLISIFLACKKEEIKTVVPPVVVEEKSILTADLPNNFTVGKAVFYQGKATGKITSVQVMTDTYELGVAKVENGAWTLSYIYNSAGKNRTLLFNGKDANGVVLATQTYTIEIAAPVVAATYITNVPYFYQYSNTKNPSGSCQNTSVAMVMKYFAAKEGLQTVADGVTPDAISTIWGTSKAQSVAGMEELFNKEAAARGIKARDVGSETMPLADFVNNAKVMKKPFIVHGYFTNYGHIMVVLGFDGTNYICNDPAGKWSQQYKKGGYSTTNDTEGVAIKYSKAAFEAAISPDGMVWVHTFK